MRNGVSETKQSPKHLDGSPRVLLYPAISRSTWRDRGTLAVAPNRYAFVFVHPADVSFLVVNIQGRFVRTIEYIQYQLGVAGMMRRSRGRRSKRNGDWRDKSVQHAPQSSTWNNNESLHRQKLPRSALYNINIKQPLPSSICTTSSLQNGS